MSRVRVARIAEAVEERRRRRETLQHRVGIRRPRTRCVLVPDKDPAADDVTIASRLLAAYGRAEGGPRPVGASDRSDLWSEIAERRQRFASILDRADAEELAQYLCNVSRHDASTGITQGPAEFHRISRQASYRDFLALMAKDKLVSLAEAVGALPLENPEQGTYGSNLYREPSELVDRISQRIGLDVTPPDIDGGLLKLDTGRGLFGERDANAIYTAWLLKRILEERAHPRVCEIGGGSGRVAYWSHRLGLTAYTIIDLPHINVVQGYYALKNLPADQVSLYGEQPPGEAGTRVEVLPAHAVIHLREPTFDVVLNQDSFPEINCETVAEYLEWIRWTCTGSLVSINHESKPRRPDGVPQLSVPEVIRDAGGFALTQRWPYWLRKGYVVEIYRVAEAGGAPVTTSRPARG